MLGGPLQFVWSLRIAARMEPTKPEKEARRVRCVRVLDITEHCSIEPLSVLDSELQRPDYLLATIQQYPYPFSHLVALFQDSA